MTISSTPRQDEPVGTVDRVGKWSVVLGLLGLAGLVWAWLLTTTIDPPNWVRIPGLVLLPVGGLGSLVIGGLALLTAPRRWAALGLSLGLLTLAGLTALELAHG